MKTSVIRSVKIANYTTHKSLRFNLASTGITVITGANGSGKSSVIDAIAWAQWGDTLRGEQPPRPDDGEVKVMVTTETHTVLRVQAKRDRLHWNRNGEEAREFVSTTLAQQELEKDIGGMDQWRRTHVFTSDDISYFLASPDAERKKFVEQMLGLDRYVPAFKKADAEYRAAQRVSEEHRREVDRLEGALSSLEVEDVGERPEKPDQEAAKAIRAKLRTMEFKPPHDVADLRARERILSSWVKTLGEGTCPTCKAEVDKSVIRNTRDKLNKVREALAEAEEAEAEARAEYKRAKADLNEQLELLEERAKKFEDFIERKERAERAAARKTEAERKLTAAKDKAKEADEETEHLKECVAALSTKGVRAWVVGQVMDTVSRRANEYLAIVGSPLRVELTGSIQLKNGDVRDEIGIKIIGAGGGKYRGASQGQRQRIALCVRLALAEVAGDGGTLFLDEAFSNIDDAGLEGVVELMRQLATTRNIVVITHSQRLAKALGGKLLHIG